MGIGSSGVVNCANTYLGTANYTVADGYVADRTVIVDGNGPAQLNLNFARNEVLDPRITFSRTSNATRVNVQGLIEYAPHNLLTNSENFDNAAWIKTTATLTANAATAPDGTTTADNLTATGADSAVRQQNISATAGQSYVFSVYLRADIPTTLGIFIVDGGGGTGNTQQVVNVTTSWQRFTVTRTLSAGTTVISAQIGGANSFSTGESVYCWGAQLNIGSLQPYYTTSVKNLLGYSQNFENAAWTKSNSNVLTNLLTYSQEFDNAVWAKTNATVTANAIAAPDGTITGDTVLAVAAGGDTGVRYTTTQTSSTVYTASIYAKYTNARYLVIRNLAIGAALGDQWTFFDLLNGTVGTKPASVTAVITPVGGGWYRCSVSATTLATIINNFLDYRFSTTDNAYSVLNTSTINIWGAQLVQGTNPEEYTVTTSAPAPIQVMGPLGFVGAEKLVENTVNAAHYTIQTATILNGTPFTASIFIKAGERTFARVRLGDAGFIYEAVINLATGIVTSTNGVGSNSVVNLGNGWFRLSCTGAVVSGNIASIGIYLRQNATTEVYTGDGTSGIYIFGAQLSDSASLDPYSYNFGAAPTSSAYYGPRFDYDPVTLAPKGLLIEESRANLFLQSEAFDNASWTKERSSISQNVAISPDGTQDADKFIEDTTASNTHQLYQSFAATSGTSYTASFYVKASERNWVAIRFYATNSVFTSSFAFFDVTNGVVGTVNAGITASITPVGNGWYRCTATRAAAATASGFIGLNLATADNTTSYTGDGSSGAFVWGAQLEAGSFPTSYIPTTSAQVTRTADNASMTGTNFSSWYNQSEGTVATEYDIFSTAGTFISCSLNDNTNTNAIQSYCNSGLVKYQVVSSSNIQAELSASSSTNNKTAFSYKLNDFAVSFNAGAALTDSLGTVPTVNQLRLGAFSSGALYLNGHIQSFKYFNKRLLNSYLQSLTQ